jgi:hypothetical protein
MITDEQVEKANDFIRDNAGHLAQAKAERIYLEQFRKSKKAMLVSEVSGTVQEREAHAYAHKDYLELLQGLKEAVETEERLRFLIIAAQARIEIWRTQSANERKGV